MEMFKGLSDVLQWLVGTSGGAFIVITWVTSWALEKAAWWGKLNSMVKSISIIVLSGVLGGLSQLLLTRPDIVVMIDPYFKPIMYAALLWVSSQAFHGIDPTRKGLVESRNQDKASMEFTESYTPNSCCENNEDGKD